MYACLLVCGRVNPSVWMCARWLSVYGCEYLCACDLMTNAGACGCVENDGDFSAFVCFVHVCVRVLERVKSTFN